MINLNELTESVKNLLFGKVTVEMMQGLIVVECVHSDDYFYAKGRFIIESDKIIFAFINTKDYIPNDKIFPAKEVTKLARRDNDAIAEVLEIFEDCQIDFGYDSTIIVKGDPNGK